MPLLHAPAPCPGSMPLLHPALLHPALCARSSRASLQRASYSADDAARVYLSFHHPAIGGTETIASYGVYLPDRIRKADLADLLHAEVPDTHKAFLRALKTSHHEDGLFFAHAGIRPGVPLDQQVENDLLWIRQEFHSDKRNHGSIVVHGHTPVDAPERYANRINLDTGAGYGRPLTVAVFEGDEVFRLTDAGRERIPSRS